MEKADFLYVLNFVLIENSTKTNNGSEDCRDCFDSGNREECGKISICLRSQRKLRPLVKIYFSIENLILVQIEC